MILCCIFIVACSNQNSPELTNTKFSNNENSSNKSVKEKTKKVLASGVDISGLSKEDARKKVASVLKETKDEFKISLKFEDKNFEITSSDLKETDVDAVVVSAIEANKNKSFFEKINIFNKNKNKIIIPKSSLLTGLDEKIDEIRGKIEKEIKEPAVTFKPDSKTMFSVSEEQPGVKVDMLKLKENLLQIIEEKNLIELEIPVFYTLSKKTKKEVEKNLVKRAEFSTNYSNSVGGRRHNILLALSAFNGLKIEPEEVISFNKIIDTTIPHNKFKPAKIIVGGEFVDGIGGGICQASTTMYNAVLLADLEIKEVHPHTLPVGYVKLAFDAMVNFGNSDLVFKNTLDHPVYIKAGGDETDCYVEVYGEPLPQDLKIKRKSEFIRSIPHGGDKIIPDTEGKYNDKILFKGEYHRVKYPAEGYEAKSYLQYYLDEELVEERFLRHEKYKSQQGIIYEGTEELIEGLSLPTNTVSHIPPQKESITNSENVEDKIKVTSPAHYSP